jgi:hypothetical protein
MMRREYAERLLDNKIIGYSPKDPKLSDYVKLFEIPGLAKKAIFGRPIIVVHYINHALELDKYVREQLDEESKDNTVFLLYLLTEDVSKTIKKYKSLPHLIWVADNPQDSESGLKIYDFYSKLYPFANEVELWGGSREVCVALTANDLEKNGFKVRIRKDCTFV